VARAAVETPEEGVTAFERRLSDLRFE